MSTCICIPVREKSSRLPDKCFVDLNGKPMIQYVYDKVRTYGYPTYVVTDSKKVASIIGKNAVMTGDAIHGTDRIMKAIDSLPPYDKYINVQGDNPDVTIDVVLAVERELDNEYVVNGVRALQNPASWRESVVRAYVNNGRIYNYSRDGWTPNEINYAATGFHGYTRQAKILYDNSQLSSREYSLNLEQVRWIDNNIRLGAARVEWDGVEINNEEDLAAWKARNV